MIKVVLDSVKILEGFCESLPVAHSGFPLRGPNVNTNTVADPRFPTGGHGPCWGGMGSRGSFKNFACQNERIWTLGGHALDMLPRSTNEKNRALARCTPLDSPMERIGCSLGAPSRSTNGKNRVLTRCAP